MKNLLWLICCTPLLLAGCATTEVKSEWKDASGKEKIGKVFVLAIVNQPASRRAVENGVVNLLNRDRLRAIPTYESFPNVDNIDKALVSKMVQEFGIDGVLVVRLVNLGVEQVLVGGTYAENLYPGGWYDYYGASRAVMLSPGYSIENYTSTVETVVYSLATNKILWGTVTDTRENAVPKAIDSYLKTIDKSFATSGLF